MNCNCRTIEPDCDMNRWESCPSTIIADADHYYTKAEIDELLEHITPSGGCCCPTFEVRGTTLVITDADDCVYVDGTTLVIGG